MARSRKRTTTGETTRIFRPPKPPKLKKRNIWPYLLVAVFIITAGYFIWNVFLKGPDLSLGALKEKFSFGKEQLADSVENENKEIIPEVKHKPEPKTNLTQQETSVPAKQDVIANKEKVETDIPEPVQRNIQVEVLNGCGGRGLAASFAKTLRKQGIDVVKTGNYKSSGVKNTQIIDRVGNKEFSMQIGEILDVKSRHIYTQKKPELLIDATIIIGKDYKQLKR